MINPILFLIPEEAWVLVLVVAGFMMIIGFRRLAWSLVASICVLALISQFVDTFLDALPLWLLAMLMIGFGLSFLQLILGRRIADNVLSYLIYDLIRAPFRILFWVLRRRERRIGGIL